MRVAITGATGFVGRVLVDTLSDVDLLLCARRPSGGDGRPVTVVGDINGETAWDATLEGTDCVVHLAAQVHIMNPTAKDSRRFHEVNVLGSARLAQAAARAGVRRFVYLSSIKVNGEQADTPFRETDAARPLDDYGRSKWQAEQALTAIAAESGMELAIIRPPLVYGPGVRANFLRLMSWVHKGIPLPFGSVRNRRSITSVWNLCDLIRTIIFREGRSTGVYLVSDGVDLSTAELIRGLARGMGKAARVLPVPEPVLWFLAAATGHSAEMSRLCGSLTVDISETRRRLDWDPPVRLEEGLRRTAEWFLQGVASRHE